MKLYFLPTWWCDVEVLEEDGKFAVIDTGAGGQQEMIFRHLEAIGVKKLEWILLTHFHPDHYGLMERFLSEFEVGCVYFKSFGGHVLTNGAGQPCDDAWLAEEVEKCRKMRAYCAERTRVIDVEKVKEIPFARHSLQLFGSENTVESVYLECGEKSSNENHNSLLAFMEVNGRTVLYGGDVSDFETKHPQTTFMGTRYAHAIGRSIDIMKAPHHGHGIGTPETLGIYKPRYVYITNTEETVMARGNTVQLLKDANPDVDITFASDGGVVFSVEEDGTVTKAPILIP